MSSVPKAKQTPQGIYNPTRAVLHSRNTGIVLFMLSHILLGVILVYAPQLVNLHVVVTLAVALLIAALRTPLTYVAAALAYIAGAEVLWRTANAAIFWEAGKYAVVLIMLISLFRTRSTLIPVAPFLYFVFLLPSILVTLGSLGLSEARQQISFNLSGPLTLFVSAWFFSRVTLKRNDLQLFLFCFIAALIAVNSLVLFHLLTLNNVHWITASNFSTSGEFGPNQVSTVLGLGVLLIVISLMILRQRSFLTVFLVLLGLWMFVQAILTFSRGGIVSLIIAVCFLVLHQFMGRKQRSSILITVVLLFVVLEISLPLINDFTFGALLERYTDTGVTGRDILLQQDIQYFMENPVTGIGPGGIESARRIAAHTEFSRMLGEHGILGLLSLFLLLFMATKNYFRNEGLLSRGIRGSLMVWSLVSMAHLAMRLAAMSLMLGFGFVTIDLSDEDANPGDSQVSLNSQLL